MNTNCQPKYGRFSLRLVVSAVVLSVFAGCSTNPATGRPEFVLMSEKEEIDIGAQTHPQILSQYRVYRDPELQAYVETIGNRLADISERANLEYTFTVLDSEEVNAFAVPGGYIYVTRGLLSYLNSEAEMAAVIGHEIGHITGRHAVRQHRSNALLGTIAAVAGAAAGAAGSAVTDFAGGALLSGYGRDMELEADALGARYLVACGYDSEAMIDVVRILKNQELFELERAKEEGREPHIYHGIFASHPDNDSRLRNVVKEADKLRTPDGETRPENRAAFLGHVDGMYFGRIKAGGVMRDNEFRHGGLGISLRFPKDWRVEDVPGKLTAMSPDRQALIVITAQPAKNRLSPVDILHKIGIEEMEDGRAVTPDGLNGYTTIAPDANSPYGRRPVRYAVVMHQERAFVFAGVSNNAEDRVRNDWKILSVVKSMRLLDEKGKRAAKPPRIRVIEANAGTTIERLAAASPLDRYAEQQLRLLNDMYPEGDPEPGQQVKIID